MRLSLKSDFEKQHSLTRLGLVAMTVLLTACAAAPGMRMASKDIPQQVDLGITPVFKSITAKLLQDEKVQREQKSSEEISALLGTPAPYVIGAGDILSITIWDHPELSTPTMTGQTITGNGTDTSGTPGFVVDDTGLIQFPYVGKLKLAGLTAAEARQLLTDKLMHYLNKPDLTLRVQAFRSKRVYVDGEVRAPGIQNINDIAMTLPEALNRAGGVLATGDQGNINISRAGTTYRVNIPRLLQAGVNPTSIMLKNDDLVRVIARDESRVFVLGEVTTPASLNMHNGRLTLNEALGEAGGVNQLSAQGRQVYVVRNAADMNPIVYNLDASSPIALALAENFELMPKDVVYVDPSSLVNWSRVVNLVIPSAVTVLTAVSTARYRP